MNPNVFLLFRAYSCPYSRSECTAIGDSPYMVARLRDEHKVDVHSGSTFKFQPQVFSCFGQCFCLHFEAFQLGMYPVYIAFLRFIGDDNDAKNHSYSLEVGGSGEKMTWPPEVHDSFDGLVIQRNMAIFFPGGDRKGLKLRVTGRIWKEQ